MKNSCFSFYGTHKRLIEELNFAEIKHPPYSENDSVPNSHEMFKIPNNFVKNVTFFNSSGFCISFGASLLFVVPESSCLDFNVVCCNFLFFSIFFS